MCESLIPINPACLPACLSLLTQSPSTGFSLPITCSCDGKGVVAGCNKYLWDLGKCPNDNGVGSCRNPLRGNTGATSATAFFAPCAHVAYTYPHDDAANKNGICTSGKVTCCVGQACAKNPAQS